MVTNFHTNNGQFNNPQGIAAGSDGSIYVSDTDNNRIRKFQRVYSIKLNQVDTTTGSNVSRIRYLYDSYVPTTAKASAPA